MYTLRDVLAYLQLTSEQAEPFSRAEMCEVVGKAIARYERTEVEDNKLTMTLLELRPILEDEECMSRYGDELFAVFDAAGID